MGCGCGRCRSDVRRRRCDALHAESSVNEVEDERDTDIAADLVAIDKKRGRGVDFEALSVFLRGLDNGGVLLGEAGIEPGYIDFLENALIVGDLVEILVDLGKCFVDGAGLERSADFRCVGVHVVDEGPVAGG